MPADRRTWTANWMPALVWAVAVFVVCVVVCYKPAAWSVYSIYAHAGRGWLEGRDVYDLPPNSPVVDVYRYSPIVAAFFGALAQLPQTLGGILWRLLGVALVVGGFAYACRTFDSARSEKSDRRRQWMWLLLLPLCVANLNNGQANLHVVGLLLIGVAAVADERWNLAASALTIACLIKVYPIALVGLLTILHPRRLTFRFGLAMALGLAAPFLTQSTAFVLDEYRIWLRVMLGDDRFSPEHGTSYRDLSQLLFLAGVRIDRASFLAVQATLGVVAAATCLFAKRRLRWTDRRLVGLAYCLGTLWMLLCGPCTESSTYVLLAPVAAWLVVDAACGKYARPAAWAIVAGAALVHLALFSSAFPFFRAVHAAGVHPLGALILAIGYLMAEFRARNADDKVSPVVTSASLRLPATIAMALQSNELPRVTSAGAQVDAAGRSQ